MSKITLVKNIEMNIRSERNLPKAPNRKERLFREIRRHIPERTQRMIKMSTLYDGKRNCAQV